MAKNILIVDDAAFMRMMIKDILTKNVLDHHSHEILHHQRLKYSFP